MINDRLADAWEDTEREMDRADRERRRANREARRADEAIGERDDARRLACALEAEVARARAALEVLLDEQNGVPLLSRAAEYSDAYASACRCLGRDTCLPDGWDA